MLFSPKPLMVDFMKTDTWKIDTVLLFSYCLHLCATCIGGWTKICQLTEIMFLGAKHCLSQSSLYISFNILKKFRDRFLIVWFCYGFLQVREMNTSVFLFFHKEIKAREKKENQHFFLHVLNTLLK